MRCDMSQTEQLMREWRLLQEIRQLKIDNNILRKQRDEWRDAARGKQERGRG